MRNRAYFFFPLSMFIYRWEENDHVSSTVFFPIGCRSRKSLFICIKLKDSELCRVAGHAPSSRQRSLSLSIACCRSCRRKSPALHWNEWDRVALSLSVACSVNGAWSVSSDATKFRIPQLYANEERLLGATANRKEDGWAHVIVLLSAVDKHAMEKSRLRFSFIFVYMHGFNLYLYYI